MNPAINLLWDESRLSAEMSAAVNVVVDKRPLLETLREIDPKAQFGIDGMNGGAVYVASSAAELQRRIANAITFDDKYASLRSASIVVDFESTRRRADRPGFFIPALPPALRHA